MAKTQRITNLIDNASYSALFLGIIFILTGVFTLIKNLFTWITEAHIF